MSDAGVQQTAREEARNVTSTVGEQGSAVASTAAEGAREVTTQAAEQTKQVAREASLQARELFSQAQQELRQQASGQTDRAASSLRDVGRQLASLAEGRTDEAGQAGDYARQLAGKIDQIASRVEQGGLDGVIHDVTSFARRRPGMFLLGAAAAGFAIGRLAKGVQVAGEAAEALGTGSGTTGTYGATGAYGTGPTGPETLVGIDAPPLTGMQVPPLSPPLGAPIDTATADPTGVTVVVADEDIVLPSTGTGPGSI